MRCFLPILCIGLGLPPAQHADPPVRSQPAIAGILAPRISLEAIASGRFLEGPVWDAAGRRLIFSDTEGDETKTWSETKGVGSLRTPANRPNGNAFSADGQLITCEHGARTVSITWPGNRRVLAERYDGKRLNSPNDITVATDGRIWFTDPDYGVPASAREQSETRTYCLDPRTSVLTAVAAGFHEPNGIAISPDSKRLYVGDSERREVIAFDIIGNARLANRRVLCRVDSPNWGPDGVDCDSRGNIYAGSGDGVQVFSRDGTRLGRILTPSPVTNTCFGGDDRRTLFITTPSTLYRIRLLVTGPPAPPRPTR